MFAAPVVQRSLLNAVSCGRKKPQSSEGSDSEPPSCIDVVTVWQPQADQSLPTKDRAQAMFIFGVHARELVSAESGLDLVRSLCEPFGEAELKRARVALARSNFLIVPNVNPTSRRAVEEGDLCRRGNAHGVDLNRNWETPGGHDGSWRQAWQVGTEEDPGPEAFSEPETTALLDLIKEMSPDLLVDVHSGAYFLATPDNGTLASPGTGPANAASKLLSAVSKRYCKGQCPVGSLSNMEGRLLRGCAIDYAAGALSVPFAFAFEIYADPTRRERWAEEGDGKEKTGSFLDIQLTRPTLEAATQRLRKALTDDVDRQQFRSALDPGTDKGNPEACARQFFPLSAAELDSVLRQWSPAFLDTSIAVASLMGIGGGRRGLHKFRHRRQHVSIVD